MQLSILKVVLFYFLGFLLFTGGFCVKTHNNFGIGLWVAIIGVLVWGLPVLSWSYYGELD